MLEAIREAPYGLPLSPKGSTQIYLYNIVARVYGEELSPMTNTCMQYDIDGHVDAFLVEDIDNIKGPYRNAHREHISSRQLFSYTSCSDFPETVTVSKLG